MRWQGRSVRRCPVPGAATGGPGRQGPHAWGRWQQVLADALDQNLAIGVRAAVADHLGRTPTRAELTAARRAAHSSPPLVVPACSMCRAPMATTMQAIATIYCWRSRM